MRTNVVRIFLAVVWLSSTSSAFGAEPIDVVVKRLSQVQVYAFGGTGYAGVISQGEKDFHAILASPDALSTFEKLLRTGNPEAKCYALFGVRKLSPSRFTQLSEPLRGSQNKVVTMRGCVIDLERMGAIVRRIEKNKF